MIAEELVPGLSGKAEAFAKIKAATPLAGAIPSGSITSPSVGRSCMRTEP